MCYDPFKCTVQPSPFTVCAISSSKEIKFFFVFHRMDLEQIVALLPSTKGVALADLVKQSLISPAIVHYSALLQVIDSFQVDPLIRILASSYRRTRKFWTKVFIQCCKAILLRNAWRLFWLKIWNWLWSQRTRTSKIEIIESYSACFTGNGVLSTVFFWVGNL